MERKLFTSESVSPGHPDSAMDYVANSVLDEILKMDPNARVAVDGVSKNENVVLAGEITSVYTPDYEEVVKKAYKEIGYEFEPKFTNLIFTQSADIALGTNDEVGGAGDQGIMFGYANNETEEYFPLAISASHKIIQSLYFAFKDGSFPYAKADMKSQVTIDYTEEQPVVDTVVVAVQHSEEYNEEEFKSYIKGKVDEVLKELNIYKDDYKLLINGTGRFVIGGPIGDSGEVGRKIVVDAYGGYAPVGGGTQNGKDCSKVDRSAAYMARYVAKNIVAAGLADECLIELGYCIGVAEPVSLSIDTKGTAKVEESKIVNYIRENISFTPKNIISRLNLKTPMFKTWGLIGHVGTSYKQALDGTGLVEVPWEKLDLVEDLKSLLDE